MNPIKWHKERNEYAKQCGMRVNEHQCVEGCFDHSKAFTVRPPKPTYEQLQQRMARGLAARDRVIDELQRLVASLYEFGRIKPTWADAIWRPGPRGHLLLKQIAAHNRKLDRLMSKTPFKFK